MALYFFCQDLDFIDGLALESFCFGEEFYFFAGFLKVLADGSVGFTEFGALWFGVGKVFGDLLEILCGHVAAFGPDDGVPPVAVA